MKKFGISWVVFWALCLPAHALTLRPLNIDQLTDKAGRIVVGTVTKLEEQPSKDGRAPAAIVARISVTETYKGSASKELLIRQFATMGPGKKLRTPYGLPMFRKGERVLVFLPNSTDSGLASPVGLGQGVFRLMGDKPNSPAINEFQNRTLFHGTLSPKTNGVMKRLSLKPTSHSSSVTLSQLKEIIRERTSNAR